MSTTPHLTLSEILAKKTALQDQITELEDLEHRVKYQRAVARQDLLHQLVDRARVYLDSDELDIMHIHEGLQLAPECVFDPGPYSGNHEVAVQVYAARKRKGEVEVSNKVNQRNPSYPYDEQVVVSFVIPRGVLEETLDKLTELEKEA